MLGPLRVEAYLGIGDLPRPAARTRDVRGRAAGTEIEPFNSAFWRSLAMPWAGLVTTAEGALRLVDTTADLVRLYGAAIGHHAESKEYSAAAADPYGW